MKSYNTQIKMNRIDDTRKRICDFYEIHRSCSKTITLNHFKMEGISKSTIYRAIKRVENGIGAERCIGQGRVAVKMDFKGLAKLRQFFDHKTGRSQNAAARKFIIDQSYVCKLLKDLAIDCRKKGKKLIVLNSKRWMPKKSAAFF